MMRIMTEKKMQQEIYEAIDRERERRITFERLDKMDIVIHKQADEIAALTARINELTDRLNQEGANDDVCWMHAIAVVALAGMPEEVWSYD